MLHLPTSLAACRQVSTALVPVRMHVATQARAVLLYSSPAGALILSSLQDLQRSPIQKTRLVPSTAIAAPLRREAAETSFACATDELLRATSRLTCVPAVLRDGGVLPTITNMPPVPSQGPRPSQHITPPEKPYISSWKSGESAPRWVLQDPNNSRIGRRRQQEGNGNNQDPLSLVAYKLRKELPQMLEMGHSVSIYDDDVRLVDNIMGLRITGKSAIKLVYTGFTQMACLYFKQHSRKLFLLSVEKRPEESAVYCRWRLVGIPRFRPPTLSPLPTREVWFDALSVFEVNPDTGKICRHTIDKISPPGRHPADTHEGRWDHTSTLGGLC